MRDYYAPRSERQRSFAPPKVKQQTPSSFAMLIGAFIACVMSILAVAGVLWIVLWGMDRTTWLSFKELTAIATGYLLIRSIDKVLFGQRDK